MAATHGDNRGGGFPDSLQGVDDVPAADLAEYAVILQGDGAFHDQNEFAAVMLNSVLQRSFGLRTPAGLQGFMVIQRDQVKDELFHRGELGPKQ